MNLISPLASPQTPASDDDIIAQLDADPELRNTFSAAGPTLALAVFIGAALPALALFTLRDRVDNFPCPAAHAPPD